MTQWADYSGGRPSGAALAAAGFSGAIRYVGIGSSGKRLAAGEYANLTSAGIQVLLVAESGTADAWGTPTDDDRARGRANATAALSDARALGVPDSVGIAAAADAHALNQIQINDAVAYARGFEDVLGHARTGFYGFSEVLNQVRNAGVASWYWLCGSAPSAATQGWLNFWQRNSAPTTRVVSGVPCDINDQYNPVGVPAPSATSTTTTEDDDMAESLPAGTNVHKSYIVPKGATELYFGVSGYGDTLLIHQADFWGATPATGRAGVGGGFVNFPIAAGRPGPLAVPAGAVQLDLNYDANHAIAVSFR